MKFSLVALVAIMTGLASLCVQAQDQGKERVINGGVLNGKARSLPKPDYPAHLREQGKGGTVNVDVVIDESGLVVSATGTAPIKARAGAEGMVAERDDVDASLIEAAEQAARQAQFAPTFLSGVPVKIKGTITYNFVAGSEAAADDYKNDGRGGILNSKAVSLPKPVYPPAARAVNAEGSVTVLVKVSESGVVLEAHALNGHPLLRAAAVKAATEARFDPTLQDGKPVQVSGLLVYNFVGGGKTDQ